MADSAEQFLMEKLKQNLVYNAKLIIELKDNVESLYTELRTLKAFLVDNPKKQREFEIVKVFARQTTNLAYAAEDVIDAFMIQAPVQKPREEDLLLNHSNHDDKKFDSEALQVSGSSTGEDVIDVIQATVQEPRQGLLLNHPVTIHKASKEIQEMREKVKEVRNNKTLGSEAVPQVVAGSSSNGGTPVESALVLVEEDNNVVGFDKEISTLVDRLTTEQEKLEILSVIGTGGLGKTTLAWEVYTNPRIEHEFDNRAWVYVSQEYNRRDVFLDILSAIQQLTYEMFRMNDQSLAEELHQKLQRGRYLIILDNVWTPKAWDHLKIAFPNNKNKSRVMLTSRNTEVAVHASPNSVHHLRFLTDDESWELLRKKVFREESCPSKLEDLGKQIARACEGLPLIIVVIAGLLIQQKVSYWWERVAKSVKEYVAKDPQQCREVLTLSYDLLPKELKPCFLYFGIFPGDFEIPVWKLIRLWVAEGFIPQIGKVNLEDIAEEYLEDLVDRNLVMVEKRRSNGRTKTCRVHDMLRDLCLKQADEENFFNEIKGFDPNSSLSSNPTKNNQRRLCTHYKVLGYISSTPSAPHARSLLCFSLEEIELPLAHKSFIPDTFKLIRVLDIKHIHFPRFPSEIIQLIRLRYIALSGDFNILPASISKLLDTQTLIVDTSSPTLGIKADIWKMLNLRHLYTRASSQLPVPTKGRKNVDSGERSNIQTMSTISPESCTENILDRTPNLKKLGIRGKLLSLLEVKGGSSLFDNLAKLEKVETMKLLNTTHSPLTCILPGLPQGYKFPPNLKKLTLSNTLVEWKHMETLGLLQNLEVLKLKDNAFTGWQWQSLDGGFQLLKVLHIGRTDLEKWNTSAHHFPRLQHLVIRDCEKLEEIPSSLGNISTLQTMELYRPTSVIADSARKIKEQRQQMQQDHSSVNSGFKLTIYTPDV